MYLTYKTCYYVNILYNMLLCYVYQPSNALAAWTSILYPAPVTQPQVLTTTPPIRAKNQIILSTQHDK